MYKKSYVVVLLFTILAIAIFHNLATTHFIYWRYLWSDLIIHFIAGLWIAMVGFWVFRFWMARSSDYTVYHILTATLVLSFAVGIFWEGFEYAFGLVIYSSKYLPDTFSDILMDISGGAVGFFCALAYKRLIDKNI